MKNRRQVVYGIAALLILVGIAYGIQQWTNPYRGLTLVQDVEMMDEERVYVENRIRLTLAALDAQRGADEADVDLDLYLSLAWDYSAIGDLVNAREIYEAYFEFNDINYTAWSNYGTILKKMGDIKNAEAAYLQALQLSPTEANYRNYVLLLQNYYEDGERDADILATLLAGVTTEGQTPWFMVTLAEYYLKHDDCAKAFDHYEAAMALAPENTSIIDDFNAAREVCQ